MKRTACTPVKGRLRFLLAGSACALAAVPMAANALVWDYVPTMSVSLGYSTNPEYFSQSSLEDDAYSGTLDVAVDVYGETARSRIDIRPRVRGALSAGSENDSELNTLDYYLPLSATWTNPRSQYGLTGGYTQISTRVSEIFVADPNNPSSPGTSGRVVAVDENQERWYIGPSAQFSVSRRDMLGLSVDYEDVSYDEAALTGRSNYTYTSGSASLTHTLDEKNQISTSINLSGFRADNPANPAVNDTVSYGFDFGYQHALSAITSIGLSLGASKSDIEVSGLAAIDADDNPTTPPVQCFNPDPPPGQIVLCTLKSTDSNFTGRVFYRQQLEQNITTEFSVSRALQPNSDGAQVTQDLARAYVARDFTEHLNGSVGLSYIQQSAVGEDTAGSLAQRFDQEYFRAELGVGWRLTRTWLLRSQYTFYRNEQKSGTTSTVTNNSVFLQLQYVGLGSH